MAELNLKKRVRVEEHDDVGGDVGLGLPEVKKLREDLLENLDDEDDDICSVTADLDSFMKSFEEEISPVTVTITEAEAEAEAEEALPDLGYLLEASDDELGLPPSTASPSQLGDEEVAEVAELVNVSAESGGTSGLRELWGFDENVTGYDSFDLGVGSEYVALDGLFDYSSVCFESADFVCQQETLPAQ